MNIKLTTYKQHIMYFCYVMFVICISISFNLETHAAQSKYVKSLVVKNNISLKVGEKESIPIKVNVVNKASKRISYKISNKKVAKASYSSKTSKLTITGVKKGSTKVTITTKARNSKGIKLKRIIKVTVKAADVTTESTTEDTGKKYEKTYTFRKPSYLTQHFEKHGAEMGYKTEEAYLAGANAVINNSKALHKLEAEDNDHIYYIEDTNEIVFLSQDGYIRTYFICSGKAYYDRQ